MIPLHLNVSGFLSYRDAVDLDFTSFELACISGQNGAGKSSLLDAITWALFGQARKRDDSIINSHSDAAEVRLDFAYEKNVYRVQRSKPRDKATLLEFYIRQDGKAGEGNWKPLTERSVRDTETCIQQTLRMDYETFTNASFFLQGKADQFAQQRPSDRKRILSSILGLEVWEEYREKTVERRKALEAECTAIDGRLHEINAELGEAASRQARLKELEATLENLAKTRTAQESAVESLRQLVNSLARQRDMVENLERQWKTGQQNRDRVETRLSERLSERQTYAVQLEQAEQIEAAYQAWQAAREELQRWDETAARFREHEKTRSGPLLEIEKARHALQVEQQRLAEMQKMVSAGQSEVEVLQGQIKEIEQAMGQAEARIKQRGEIEGQLRELHQSQADARAENPRLKGEMEELRERIGKLEHSEGATCPLCGQPLSLQEREQLIATLNQQGKTLAERYRQNQALLREFETRLGELEREYQGFSTAESELRGLGRQLDQAHARQQQIAQMEADWLARGAPREQEIARSLAENNFALEFQAELARIDADLRALGYDAAAHDELRRREQAGRSSESALRGLEKARAALGPLERETADLEKQAKALQEEVTQQEAAYLQAAGAYAAAAADAPDLGQAESDLFQLREQENRLRMEVGAARQKVLVLEDLRSRQIELSARRNDLTLRTSQHKTLERAFSKDGVPALLIEQALPEIESQANELLERLSGGNMSVSFQTQREYKDKNRADLRETLDILISDGAGTRDYEMFSGGESFRVNFAIRLALSKVLAQRAGARLQTLVIDEGFGSQDAQGRQKLIEAINLVRPDFSKILVITHLEELKDFFPNRIEVEKTSRGSTLKVL